MRHTRVTSILALAWMVALAYTPVVFSDTIVRIPQESVDIEISGMVSTGSHIAFDFTEYWNGNSCTGTEQLSVWIVIPNRGNPTLDIKAMNSSGYQSTSGDFATVGRPVIMRGVRMASLTVFPRFLENNQWTGVEEISIQVRTSGNGINEVEAPKKSRAFENIIDSFVINPPEAEGVDEFDQEHLLVIIPDFAEDVLESYVNWKRQKGLEVTLSTLGDIGVSIFNPTGLRDYILEAYETWDNPPDFVLLAGDETVLPYELDYTDDPTTIFSSASFAGLYPDENYFARLEGDDFFPDIILGRWVVNTEYEYVYLGNKIITYEKTPYMGNPDWFTRGAVAAQDTLYYQGDPSMRETKLAARDMMLANGFTQVDTLFGQSNPYALTTWVNNGRSYVNYRGAGWSSGWAGIGYYIWDLEGLSNSYMLPVVTGIGCGVGLFTEPDGNCFGEVWMLAGSLFDHLGAISFIGPGHNTHTNYNNELDLGIYTSIFDDVEPRIGASLVAGKMSMYDFFDDYFTIDPNVEEIVRVAFNQFYLLSDPELAPYNSTPADLFADFPATVLVGSQTVDITITDGSGQPFEGAVVSLYLEDDFQAVDATGPDGTVSITSEATYLPAYVKVTATAHNHLPMIDSILVITESQYVLHSSNIIEDLTGGNGDGALSPGENVDWVETLINYGIAPAPDVEATLSSAHPLVTITQSAASFGDMPSGQTAVGTPDYSLELGAEQYTIGDEISFQVDIRDGDDSTWTSEIIMDLATPSLEVVTLSPDPSGNNQLDRGETCDMSFTIRNNGMLPISSGYLELITDDPYVELLLSSISCGSINVNGTYYSGQTPFVLSVSPYTPTLHEIVFWVKLTSDEGTYTFADSTWRSFEVGQYTQEDPTTNITSTYYAYETMDTLYSEAPEFEWFEIDPDEGGPGTLVPFTYEDQLFSIGLPFSFRYWGEDYSHVTISADGWIAFNQITYQPPENYNIPYQDQVPGIIAGLWDNLWNPTSETGQVSTYTDQTRGRYYIEYHELSHQSGTTPKETFQIVLCDPDVEPTATGDGEILFFYKSLHFFGISFSTVGIENPNQLDGIQYSFNGDVPSTVFGLADSLAIRFTTDEPFIVGVETEPENRLVAVPQSFLFDPAYPNPFNPTTTLRFGLPTAGHVTLGLYNIHGQRVVDLIDGQMPSGYHSAIVDAAGLSSGIYFARLQYRDQSAIQKLLLVK